MDSKKGFTTEDIILSINRQVDDIDFNLALLRLGLNSIQAIDDSLLLIEGLLDELFELRKKKKGVNS